MATELAQSWGGHAGKPELGRPQLARRRPGAKRQSRNGKEAKPLPGVATQLAQSWGGHAGKATAGSCGEGSRVLRGPNGSLGTVRKLLREAAAWRGHTAGPELGRPRWQARAGEATAGKATAGSCREGSRVLRGPNGSLGTVRKLPGLATQLAQSWGGHAGRATAGSCREGSGVLRGPNGSLGTVRKLLREAAAWRGHTAGPELGRPRWQADGKPVSEPGRPGVGADAVESLGRGAGAAVRGLARKRLAVSNTTLKTVEKDCVWL